MGTLVSSTNKTDFYDIAKILLKVVLNTIILSPKPKVDTRRTDIHWHTTKGGEFVLNSKLFR